MEIVKQENVNVENALLIEGLTLTEVDNEIEKYLQRFGSISKNLIIDDPESEFHRNAIVEYSHNSAIQKLLPLLPLTLGSLSDPAVTFRVRTLPSAYTKPTSRTATEGYLEELRAIAKESGRPFQSVLQEELEKIADTHSVNPPPATDAQDIENKNPTKSEITFVSPPVSRVTTEDVSVPTSLTFPVNIIDPPGVQRMVVEHIVKSDNTSQQTLIRLRAFSGKSPRPPNEPDFDTWRASVDFLLNDPSISDLHRTRKILDSLLPPAADVVKHVHPPALPAAYLEILESVYGSVEDGDELLAKFMSTCQNQSEKPSGYLHRLQVILSTTIRRNGIMETERDRYLLKQFCRGCWDNSLIADLQLEKREAHPPAFAELAVLIRTQEDKQASKEERMKKHLGLSKPSAGFPKLRVPSNQMLACPCDIPHSENSEMSLLRKQVVEIQAQVTALKQPPDQKNKKGFSEKVELTALKGMVEELSTQVAAVKESVAQSSKSSDLEESEIRKLRSKVAELQAQSAIRQTPQAFYMQRPLDTVRNNDPRKSSLRTDRPRAWYCFSCGEDGHLAVNCENAANPAKVTEKRAKLREQQRAWDSQYGRPTQPLN